MSMNRENLFFNDENFEQDIDFNSMANEMFENKGRCRCESSTDKLCKSLRDADRASGCVLEETYECFDRIKDRENESNIDILCRANKQADDASERILCEACNAFREMNDGCGCRCRYNKSYTDILCKLNKQAEVASNRILCQTCREYNENKCKCKCNQTSADILCKMNRDSEAISKNVLGKTCSYSEKPPFNPYNDMLNEEACDRQPPLYYNGSNDNLRGSYNNSNNFRNCYRGYNNYENSCYNYNNYNGYSCGGYNCNYGYNYGENYELWIIILLIFFCGGAGLCCF